MTRITRDYVVAAAQAVRNALPEEALFALIVVDPDDQKFHLLGNATQDSFESLLLQALTHLSSNGAEPNEEIIINRQL